MTKKDYELIARELRAQHELIGNIYQNTERYERACSLWAATLANENPQFKKDMFLKACGLETHKTYKSVGGTRFHFPNN